MLHYLCCQRNFDEIKEDEMDGGCNIYATLFFYKSVKGKYHLGGLAIDEEA
jgi:hypothetical protein